jgi:hypothetical protein
MEVAPSNASCVNEAPPPPGGLAVEVRGLILHTTGGGFLVVHHHLLLADSTPAVLVVYCSGFAEILQLARSRVVPLLRQLPQRQEGVGMVSAQILA